MLVEQVGEVRPCVDRGVLLFPQLVRVFGHGERIGIQFDDRIDSFAVLIERTDAGEVFLGQVFRRQFA